MSDCFIQNSLKANLVSEAVPGTGEIETIGHPPDPGGIHSHMSKEDMQLANNKHTASPGKEIYHMQAHR